MREEAIQELVDEKVKDLLRAMIFNGEKEDGVEETCIEFSYLGKQYELTLTVDLTVW